MPEQPPAWETSKENVAPLASGRTKASLHTALTATNAELASMRAGHEAAVAAAAADAPSDPLAASAAYVKWAVGAYPPRSPALVAVLEAACRRFQDDARYVNDARFIRFWVRYADARDDALEVFGFMGERGIGSAIGLYYEALATSLEYKRDFGRADVVFREGIAKVAQPLPRLVSRYNEFLERMTARGVRDERRAARAAREKKRAGGGGGSGGGSGLAPRPRDENERPALGKLTTREARTGLRPVLAPKVGRAAGLGAQQRSAAGDGNADTSFKVFADPVAAGGGSGSGSGSGSGRNDGGGGEAKGPAFLPSFDQVRKENEGALPVKMAGATFEQNKGMVKARVRAGLRQRPDGGGGSFQIHADPPSADAAGGGGGGGGIDALGGRLDLATKQENWTPAGPARPLSARPTPASPTINTRIAMQEVEDMFNTSLPFERGDTSREDGRESDAFPDPQPLPVLKTEVPAFQIFCDDAAPEPPREKKEVDGESAAAWPVDDAMPERQLSRAASSAMSVVEEVDVSAPSVATAMPLRRPGSAKEVDRQIGEWCFESAADLMGYECCADGDIDMESGNVVDLKGEGGEVRTFFVESIIGSGPEKRSAKLQSTVFSATLIDGAAMADDDEDELVVAIKASGTVFLLWEFYIYSTISTRVAVSGDPHVRGLDCVSKALFFYHAEPLSFLITDRVSVATIAQVSDLAVEIGSCDITEPITMFFVIDLFRAVEMLHSVGVIHADITLQNVVLRKGASEAWSGPYNAAGHNGWGQKGIALVDFNHAVDTHHEAVGGLTARDVCSHTAFLGDAHMEPANKFGEGEAWGFNADCRAIANFAGSLLNVSKDRRSATKGMWQSITDKLLGVTCDALGESTSAVMRECRRELDDALASRCEADGGAGLRGDLKSLIVAAREASLAGDVTC